MEKLHSLLCSGTRSTRIGDLLGTPCSGYERWHQSWYLPELWRRELWKSNWRIPEVFGTKCLRQHSLVSDVDLVVATSWNLQGHLKNGISPNEVFHWWRCYILDVSLFFLLGGEGCCIPKMLIVWHGICMSRIFNILLLFPYQK